MMKAYIISICLLLVASIAWSQEEPFKYDDHGKRDPLWKLVSPSGVILNYDKDLLITDMVIEGIMAEGDGNNIAIINGTIVKVNDKVGMFVVKKIDLNKVVLEQGGKEYVLNLKQED